MFTRVERHMTATAGETMAELDNGPYDVEFFFDPGCPFAWQTSVWIRRVAELRGIKIGWRFISLRFINEKVDLAPERVAVQQRSLRYHRICAAARQQFGNEAVGQLYRAWGDRYWYTSSAVDTAEIVRSLGLPEALLEAADDTSWDGLIRAESDEALRRTGSNLGTPIITYDPPTGNSFFGPVISAVPDDKTAVAFYDALRTLADFSGFSELKRTDRAPLELPVLAH
ncbi:MAG: DsbA family protein [Actinomycetota bacterium]|nr:DsbA family protein [Actinomycetota bacterium]